MSSLIRGVDPSGRHEVELQLRDVRSQPTSTAGVKVTSRYCNPWPTGHDDGERRNAGEHRDGAPRERVRRAGGPRGEPVLAGSLGDLTNAEAEELGPEMWSDHDLDGDAAASVQRPTRHRRRSSERAMQQLADGTLVTGPPETDAGWGTIAIPPHIVPEVEITWSSSSRTAPMRSCSPGSSHVKRTRRRVRVAHPCRICVPRCECAMTDR